MLKYLNVKPDFTYRDDETYLLDFVHYRKYNLDFYFIRNASNNWISRRCGFRQSEKAPEIWDPVSGDIVPVRISDTEDGYINLPLTLPPYGSCFIVFRDLKPVRTYTTVKSETQDPPFMKYLNDGLIILTPGVFPQVNKDRSEKIISPNVLKLEGLWNVTFQAGQEAPQKYVMKNLVSFTTLPETSIRYFSGRATYEKPFTFMFGKEPMNDKRIYLDLGEVSEVAEVWLNNKLLGITWTKPHRFDVTGLIMQGENYLTVKVVNTWSNRIIGDAITGEKFTNTNITRTTVPGTGRTNVPWKEVPLIESGLLGPVTIETVSIIR
jgi:hypothetical protein